MFGLLKVLFCVVINLEWYTFIYIITAQPQNSMILQNKQQIDRKSTKVLNDTIDYTTLL